MDCQFKRAREPDQLDRDSYEFYPAKGDGLSIQSQFLVDAGSGLHFSRTPYMLSPALTFLCSQLLTSCFPTSCPWTKTIFLWPPTARV